MRHDYVVVNVKADGVLKSKSWPWDFSSFHASISCFINKNKLFDFDFVRVCFYYFLDVGFIQDKRRQNITIELCIIICLLRANIKILDELKDISFE